MRNASRRSDHVPVPRQAPTLAVSFKAAFTGIFLAVLAERNVRIHVVAAVLVVVLGLWLHVTSMQWLALVLAMTFVFAAELFNRALEAVVDLASPGWHPLAKQAKDTSAGAVLVTAIGAAAVGLIVFVPRLLAVWAAR